MHKGDPAFSLYVLALATAALPVLYTLPPS